MHLLLPSHSRSCHRELPLGKNQGRICVDYEVTNHVSCSFTSKAASLRKKESTKADFFLLSSSLPLSSCYSLYPSSQTAGGRAPEGAVRCGHLNTRDVFWFGMLNSVVETQSEGKFWVIWCYPSVPVI